MKERVEEVSDERLEWLLGYLVEGLPFGLSKNDWKDMCDSLRELQEFRAQRRRQMQEG